ncbi:MAG: hypothetical protein JXL97_08945 [Bacteroidales bacterium]|nr:hypothetical protein [Bacteroidales bacterium]
MKGVVVKFFIFIAFSSLLFSCGDDIPNTNVNNNTQNLIDSLPNHRPIDQYAKFISGFSAEDFSDFQQKDIYKSYSNSNETNWNYFSVNQLLVIMNWAEKNAVSSADDTSTVFYPFAGPDFTFAYAFYPYAKNYILIGLENIGEIPDLKQYSDLEIAELLNSMTDALVEFYTQGYFSTLNMKYNFRKNNVNGVVHPLLYFVYRTNNQMIDFEYFVLDEFGQPQKVDKLESLDKRIKGLKISMTGKFGNKDLYYLQVDLSDENFDDYPELIAFVSSFGNKNTFLKSASYLLQDNKLLKFRDLLISQSSKIIQDDSGFGYNFLKSHNFDVKVFGNYSRTLNLFQDFWQPDLKAEFDNQNAKKLPFRFGYNVPFDETAIIFAQSQTSEQLQYPIYKVQFRMSWEKLPVDSFPNNFKEIDYYFDEGYYKYTLGSFQTEDECREMLDFVRKNGYQDAFIVEFKKESRRTINN